MQLTSGSTTIALKLLQCNCLAKLSVHVDAPKREYSGGTNCSHHAQIDATIKAVGEAACCDPFCAKGCTSNLDAACIVTVASPLGMDVLIGLASGTV